MSDVTIWIILRHLVDCVFAVGAVALAYYDKSGWGWFIVAALILGGISLETK